MSSREPMVSVVMAVFNAEKFLSQAIESILSQSYEDFEFIIVDDGSTDQSWNIILTYQETDRRIRSVQLKQNHGVAVASNAGLKIAKGRYIARMDSDDISLTDRLAKQVEYLENNPSVGVLGSWVKFINASGKLLGAPLLLQSDLVIRWTLLFENPFYNSTTMFRRTLIIEYENVYEPLAYYGEDYDLWGRLLLKTRGENLSEVLVHYRWHDANLTHTIQNTLEREVTHTSQVVKAFFPNISVRPTLIAELQGSIIGCPPSAKHKRARLIPVYLLIWDEFCRKHEGNSSLSKLKQLVFAWSARMILYPFFQPGWLKAIWFLSKKEWKWPFYLLSKIHYFWMRRRASV